jgi:hypothetical protein
MTRRWFPLLPGRRGRLTADAGPAPPERRPDLPETGWGTLAWVLDDDERVERCILVVGVVTFPAVLLVYMFLSHTAQPDPGMTGWAVWQSLVYPLGAGLLFPLTIWIRRRRRRKRAARATAREDAERHHHKSGRTADRSL